MADIDFAEGEVVRLKSGGPKMTVTDVLQNQFEGYVLCQWFDIATSKTERFKKAVLEKVIAEPEQTNEPIIAKRRIGVFAR
jgi:uncharacterized protein YodC (DUF2158 family)